MRPRLRKGDEIRVVSASLSLGIISAENRKIAKQRFEEMGLTLSFSKHAEERDSFDSSSVASRIIDLHEAFSDPHVKGIFTTIGGYNSNQLLKYLDYDLIKKNPKVFCGYSDITALQNAILAKTGLITYSGPHFSTFGCLKEIDYMTYHFKKCLFEDAPVTVGISSKWSDDAWYLDQENREFFPNEGPLVIHEGDAEGTIVGANAITFNMLQGTPYFPSLKDTVLFLEDDYLSSPAIFDRSLQSLIQQEDFSGVKGIVIGRFQRASKVTDDLLKKIIASKKELKHLPVVANLDFGHTQPIFTFPIGGKATLRARKGSAQLTLT